MRIGTIVFLCGFILVLLPYLGVPMVWKLYITITSGVTLMVCGYLVRRRQYLDEISRDSGDRVSDTFVETTPELFS